MESSLKAFRAFKLVYGFHNHSTVKKIELAWKWYGDQGNDHGDQGLKSFSLPSAVMQTAASIMS